MRDVVEYGAGFGLVMADGSVRARVAQRPAAGPRPVPGVRPVCRAVSRRPEPRVLERRPVAPPVLALRFRVRRAVARVLVALVTVAVVVGLGLLADAVSAARTAVPSGVDVTVDPLAPGGGWPGQVLLVPAG